MIARATPSDRNYVMFLVCQDVDVFGHNAVFARELGAALADCGLNSRIVDYRLEIPRVHAALRDEDCIFFVSFNGFGSELSLANQNPGELPLFSVITENPFSI